MGESGLLFSSRAGHTVRVGGCCTVVRDVNEVFDAVRQGKAKLLKTLLDEGARYSDEMKMVIPRCTLPPKQAMPSA